MFQLRQGSTIDFNLFEDVNFSAKAYRVETRGRGKFSWFGHVNGADESQVTLVVDGKTLTGNIVVNRRMFQVRPMHGGAHIIKEVIPEGFADELPPMEPQLDKVQHDLSGELDTADFIDVLVVYSQTTANASANIGAEIQLAIDETNTAYQNSQINQRLRLVHATQVNYTETGNFSTDLNRLTATNDGVIDNVHTLRNTYGADLVSLWVESGNACGIGYLMTNPSTGFAPFGFNVVARGCATGNYSFGHELGHNMGAHHDAYVAPDPGAYAYSHGFYNTAGQWRTIMAYNNACANLGFNCTRIQRFSNPNVNYNGSPTGAAGSADNAATLNNTASFVANFRQEVVVTPPTVLLDDDFETNSIAEWNVVKGTWSVTGGNLAGQSDKKAEIFPMMPWQDSGQSGCTICTLETTVQMDTADGKVSLLGWYEDKKNTVELTLMEKKNKVLLKQKVNGTTVKKDSFAFVLDTSISYKVKIGYSGGNFQVFFNDNLVRTVSAGGVPYGNFGFRVQGCSARFANIHVE